LGILGGTFNPPHLGHLALARHAREQLRLDRVLLIPVHTPPHKPGGEDPGPEHRLRMCEALSAGTDGVSACALEIERGGASYTVDTLTSIHASHPNAQLTLILGADTASTLASWREPAGLLALADLAVAARAGSVREHVIDSVACVRAAVAPGSPRGEAVLLEMEEIEISSSLVRRRARDGEPIDGLVGAPVARYIEEHRLYAEAAESPR
jgi:nicotinate-nucleotide adenylyltransferase